MLPTTRETLSSLKPLWTVLVNVTRRSALVTNSRISSTGWLLNSNYRLRTWPTTKFRVLGTSLLGCLRVRRRSSISTKNSLARLPTSRSSPSLSNPLLLTSRPRGESTLNPLRFLYPTLPTARLRPTSTLRRAAADPARTSSSKMSSKSSLNVSQPSTQTFATESMTTPTTSSSTTKISRELLNPKSTETQAVSQSTLRLSPETDRSIYSSANLLLYIHSYIQSVFMCSNVRTIDRKNERSDRHYFLTNQTHTHSLHYLPFHSFHSIQFKHQPASLSTKQQAS